MFEEFQSSNLEETYQLVKDTMADNRLKIKQLLEIENKDYVNFVQPLVLINQRLYCKFTVLSHLNSVKNSKDTQKLYTKLLPPLTEYYSELNQNEQIFLSFDQIYKNDSNLSLEQKKVLTDNLTSL